MDRPITDSILENAAVLLDKAEILGRLDDDWQLLAELCDLALVELPRMVESLVAAVELQDANAVHRAAHKLNGSLSVFGPGPHTAAAAALQELARNRTMAQVPEVLNRLERYLNEFSIAVAALGKEAHARSGS